MQGVVSLWLLIWVVPNLYSIDIYLPLQPCYRFVVNSGLCNQYSAMLLIHNCVFIPYMHKLPDAGFCMRKYWNYDELGFNRCIELDTNFGRWNSLCQVCYFYLVWFRVKKLCSLEIVFQLLPFVCTIYNVTYCMWHLAILNCKKVNVV